tara:strand:- start:546 stop:1619 length:1074 start_codon:yes stop_codon:yes gene_type:complete
VKKNFFLVLSSIFISLFFIEIFCNFFFFKKVDYNYKNRYLIFSEGKVFKNIENFFTYEPSQTITASNYYYKDDKFIEVYNYDININNLGLVQDNDLKKDVQSILFLGDSFTEGQGGGGSWINLFGGNYNNYQIINGGLLGTGFQQFELLNNYLSDYDIKKVFVLFLGDDLRRDVFQFNSQQLKCLMNHRSCNGSESFYGFPINKKKPELFLKNLRKNQLNNSEKEKLSLKKIRRGIKSWFADLYVIKIPLDFLRSNFYKSKNEKIKKNFNAIDNLIKIYKKDIFFVNLKMKDEIIFMNKSYETIYAKDYILSKTENYFECDFNNNLNFFHKYDPHPNQKGYESLYNCILDIFKKGKI